MALVESLLTAIVRADGDALVMHVGERPYVVASAGPIELSTQGLNLQAMAGMVAQLLPPDAQRALTEFGAVEHELVSMPEMQGDRFTVVVARGGDDVWIEVRRHRRPRVAEAAEITPPPVAETAAVPDSAPVAQPVRVAQPVPVAEPAPFAEPAPVAATAGVVESSPVDVIASPAAHVAEHDVTAAPEIGVAPTAVSSEPVVVPQPEPAPIPEPIAEAISEPAVVQAAEPVPSVAAEPTETELHHEPAAAAEATTSEQIEVAPAAIVEPETSPVPMHVMESVIEFPVPALASTAATHVTAADEATASASASARENSVELRRDLPISASGREGGPSGPAPVIPMTRTLRIEVPPPSVPRQAASDIERLLGIAAARGATALYLTTQASPYIRVDADVRVLEGEPPLSSTDVEAAVLELMPEAARDAMRRGESTEWESEIADIGPVRCSTFRDHRGPGAIFQLISMRPIGAEQLGLAAEVQSLTTEIEGLVLVATPRASGKTTLVGSLVDLINRQRPAYVITLERQIRVVHEPGGALISQREVRGTTDEWVAATRSAMRENPDVLVIQDLSSAEMCQLALDAAGYGVLVIASVAAVSTAAAIARLVELFPQEKRRAAQSLVAERLRGAVAQALLRRVGGGRVAAREVLLATPAVTNVIADGQFEGLAAAFESGRKHGLVSLTDALVHLVRTNQIDLREAYRKAADRDALVAALKRENLETALLERLA